MNKVAEKIKAYNAGRIPELLTLKYTAMREDKYRFYRAIPHLLYEDIKPGSFLHAAPYAWLCGDLHLENLGSYKGDNRITYFSINDFDECLLGPPLIDITRLLGSVYVSSANLKINTADVRALCNIFIDTYFTKLGEGYIRVLEKETARGVMRRFLEKVDVRKREAFLNKRTDKKKGHQKLIIDGKHTLPITQEEKHEVIQHISNWAKGTKTPEFYKVKDVAVRIAGTSSLGLRRYSVLVEGRGGPDGFFLLDLKQTLPSCLAAHIKAKQPQWKNEAERIVEVQKRMLADPPALLAAIDIGKTNFVLKELQPTADRIDYTLFGGNTKKLKNILEDMACIYAWGNLRSSGRQGSAIADELIYFAKSGNKIKKQLVENAEQIYKATLDYYALYCKAYDKGFFKLKGKQKGH